MIASANVTLTGGLVALGKANAAGSPVSTWSPGLRILPDYELLTRTKIPPVTPNIIDVRIVRQQVQAFLRRASILAIKPGPASTFGAIWQLSLEAAANKRYPRQIPQNLKRGSASG